MRKTLIFLPAFLVTIPLIAAESLAQKTVSAIDNPDIPQEHFSNTLPLEDSIKPPIPQEMSGIENVEVREAQTIESLYGNIHQEARFLTLPDESPLNISNSTAEFEVAQEETPEATLSPQNPRPTGFYGAISGDLRFFNSIDLVGVNIPTVGAIGNISAEFNPGFGINGSAGYKFRNNLRLEGEFAYGRNDIGDVNLPGIPAAFGPPVTTPLVITPGTIIPTGTNVGGVILPVDVNVGGIPLNAGTPPTTAQVINVPGFGAIPAGTPVPAGTPTTGGTTTTPVIRPEIPATTVNASGSISTLSLLFNAYYDFPTNSNFEPYIGAGLGLSWLSANNLSLTYPGTNFGVAVDDTTLGFVYQFMAGVGYYFNPRTAVTFGYRYFDVLDRSFETPLGEINLEGIGVHNLEVGLRYFF